MRRAQLGVAAGLVALTFALYAPTFEHGFVNFDDDQYITANAHVIRGLTWDGLRWFASNPHSINWHPLTSLSHMLDCELFGLDAGWHHLMSAALHALGSVLLFRALASLTGSLWSAALVAALFSIHPLRVESVAWASERKDVLSGVFWMLTLWAYAAYARRPRRGRHYLVTLCIALGLCAKPMLVTLPVVLLLLDHWPLKRWPLKHLKPRLREKLPWFLLAIACGIVTLIVQAQRGAVAPLAALGLGARVSSALYAFGTYLVKSIWPTGLAFYYPHPAIVTPTSYEPWSAQVIAAALFLLVASAVSIRQARRRPYIFVGWWWFVITLLPVIGLVQVGEQAWADRYAYLPLVGIYIAVAFGLRELVTRRRRLLPVVSGASIVALGALFWVSARQVPTWKDSIALCERALAVTEHNAMAHNNLGLAYLEQGRSGEARRAFEAALEIQPADAKAQLNLAIAQAQAGELDQARRGLEALAIERPNMAQVRANLASVLARQGDLAAARREYKRAIELDPLAAGPSANLGLVELRLDELEGAARAIDHALELNPAHRAAWRASNELAWLHATSADPALLDPARALARARRGAAAGILEPSTALATLAAAEAAGADFAAALEHQAKALELAPRGAEDQHRTRLELYRQGQPYRSPR